MTGKERLEEIKVKFNNTIDAMLYVPYEDIKFLIEQAERVQELELEIDGWREEVQKWQQFYEESEESHSETIELLHSTASITKRYREALSIISANLPLDEREHYVDIARQALEGDDDEQDRL